MPINRDCDAVLKDFIQRSDPKQIALVGLQALTVLAGELTAKELSAFLQEASGAADQAQLSRMRQRPMPGQRMANEAAIPALQRGGPIRRG